MRDVYRESCRLTPGMSCAEPRFIQSTSTQQIPRRFLTEGLFIKRIGKLLKLIQCEHSCDQIRTLEIAHAFVPSLTGDTRFKAVKL